MVDATIARTTPSGRLLPLRHRPRRAARTATATATSRTRPRARSKASRGPRRPTSTRGSGHLWPVLSGERAEQLLQTGDTAGAAALLWAMDRYSSGVGLVPEQAWENPAAARVAVRDRSGHRLDRLRARASGRLRGAADVGAGPGRAPHSVPGRRAPARAARGRARPLRDRTAARRRSPHGHRPCRRLDRDRGDHARDRDHRTRAPVSSSRPRTRTPARPARSPPRPRIHRVPST